MNEPMVICPGCGLDVDIFEKYCPKCGAPSENASNLDPASLPEAEGRAFQSAVSAPRKPIVVICVWLLFFPLFVGSIVILVSTIVSPVGTGSQNFISFWFAIGGIALSGIMLFRVTKNYFHPPKKVSTVRRRRRKTEDD